MLQLLDVRFDGRRGETNNDSNEMHYGSVYDRLWKEELIFEHGASIVWELQMYVTVAWKAVSDVASSCADSGGFGVMDAGPGHSCVGLCGQTYNTSAFVDYGVYAPLLLMMEYCVHAMAWIPEGGV